MWMSSSTGSPAASPSHAEAQDGRERGFTLLEVLVAFAILAVAMTALLQGFGQGLTAARRTDAAGEALAEARSMLDRVGTELPLTVGATQGSAAGLEWRLEIAPRKSALNQVKSERPYALFDVMVTVAGADSAPVSLTTVRLAPAP
jgi:general secretion pathway protein I